MEGGNRGEEKATYLNTQRIRILHIQMHNPHHANPHQLTLQRLAHFLRIIRMHRRSHQFRLVLASHGRRLHVFQRRHVALCVDLHLHVEVEAADYEVGDYVDPAYEVEHEGVFEGDFLRGLHEEEDYYEVGAKWY